MTIRTNAAASTSRGTLAAVMATLFLFALLAAYGCSTNTVVRGAGGPVDESDASAPGVEMDGGAGGDASNVGASCASHAECTGSVCSRAAGRCVACRTTGDCSANTRCLDSGCVPSKACTSDRDCASGKMVCDTAGSRCVECNTADDCSGGPCIAHSCIATRPCTSSPQCADLNMVCGDAIPPAWPIAYLGKGCGECNSTADCGAGEACIGRFCAPVCRDAKRTCGSFNGASCGACTGGATCVSAGTGCATSAGSTAGITSAVDAKDRVFFENDGRSFGGAQVVQLIDGSKQPTIVATSATILDGVAASSSDVFWADVTGAIKRRARTGGAVTGFAQVPASTSSWCQGIAATDAYLVCSVVDYNNSANSGIYAYPTAGGAVARISLVVQASILAEGSYVYWADFNGVRIGRTPLAGGSSETLSNKQGRLGGVLGGFLYFDTYSNGLRRVPIAGGPDQAVFADRTYLGGSGTSLYSAGSDGLVYESALDGSNRVVLGKDSELGGAPLKAAYARAGGILIIGAQEAVLLKR